MGKPLPCSEPPSDTELSWAGPSPGQLRALTGCGSASLWPSPGTSRSSSPLSQQHTAVPTLQRSHTSETTTHTGKTPLNLADTGPNLHFQLGVPSCLIPQTQVPHLLCQQGRSCGIVLGRRCWVELSWNSDWRTPHILRVIEQKDGKSSGPSLAAKGPGRCRLYTRRFRKNPLFVFVYLFV